MTDRPDDDHLDDMVDPKDEDSEAEMSCGIGEDGRCDIAGTEWCDWHCPRSNDAAHNRSIRHRAPRAAPLLERLEKP